MDLICSQNSEYFTLRIFFPFCSWIMFLPICCWFTSAIPFYVASSYHMPDNPWFSCLAIFLKGPFLAGSHPEQEFWKGILGGACWQQFSLRLSGHGTVVRVQTILQMLKESLILGVPAFTLEAPAFYSCLVFCFFVFK